MAGQTVGSLLIRIGADIQGLQKSLSKAEREMMRFGNKMQNIGTQLTATVTLPIVGMGGAALKAYGDFQRLENGLAATMGSAEAAKQEMKALQKVAEAPALGFEQAIQGSINLQNVGLSAEQARKLLGELGNAIATTGGTAEDLSEVTRQFSQMIAKGRILEAEMLIIRQRMPLVNDAMQKAFGTKNVEAIRETGISAREFVDKLTASMEGFPRVSGGFANSMENLGISVKVAFARVGESINKAFNLQQVLDNLAKKVESVAEKFANLSDKKKKFILIAAAVAAAIGPLLIGISTTVKMVTTAVAGFKGLLSAISLLTNPIGLIVVGIAAIAAGLYILYKRSEEARDAMNRMAASLKVYAQNTIETAKVIWEYIKRFVQIVWNLTEPIRNFMLKFYATVGKIILKAMEAISSGLARASGEIRGTVGGITNVMKEMIRVFGEAVSAFFKGFEALKKSDFKTAAASFSEALIKANPIGAAVTWGTRIGQAYAKGYAEAAEKGVTEKKPIENAIEEEIDKGIFGDLGEEAGDQFSDGFRGAADASPATASAAVEYDTPSRHGTPYKSMDESLGRMKDFSQGVADNMAMAANKIREVNQEGYSATSEWGQQLKDIFSQIAEKVKDPNIQNFFINLSEGAAEFGDKMATVFGAMDGLFDAFVQNRMAAIDAYYDKEKARIEGSMATEEWKQKAIQKLDEETDKKKRKIARAQAIREKILGVISATINGAIATLNALKHGPIMAGIVAAMAATQVALIASQKIPALARGGLAYGPQLAMVGDNPGARVDPEVIAPLSKLRDMMGAMGQNVFVTGRIDGRDILLVQERAQQDRLRSRGF